MVMDPMYAWVVMRNGEIVHVRLTKSMAEACANIERDVYGEVGTPNVRVVPVLMTEIDNPK